MKRPLWQIIWMVSAAACLGYYLVKTFILHHTSNTADAFIMMYGLVSLVVFVYFFKQKKHDK